MFHWQKFLRREWLNNGFLVLKVVLYAVVMISEVLRLSTKSRYSRCCKAHLQFGRKWMAWVGLVGGLVH